MDCVRKLNLLEAEEDELILRYILAKKKNKRNKISSIYSTRTKEGCYKLLIEQHLLSNNEFDYNTQHKNYFRLTEKQFNEVLSYIKQDIEIQPTNVVQEPISPKERLALTLRYLVTGESIRSLAFNYRISHSHISKLIKQTLKAMYSKLMPIFIPKLSEETLKYAAEKFWNRWNFPNCCGAIDGKHCRIKCPWNSGSLHFNYKNYFSIVLLAIVDADYQFMYIDVGSYGKESDSAIFSKTKIGKDIYSGNFQFPPNKSLPGSEQIQLPYVFVGDEAFRLTEHMMKPYPQNQSREDVSKSVFNYRLSRARRTSENAFGLLCQRFRIFYTPIAVTPETADLVIAVCCCLHNLLLRDSSSTIESTIDMLSRHNQTLGTVPLARAGGNSSISAINIRNEFKNYFNSVQGQVSWQPGS